MLKHLKVKTKMLLYIGTVAFLSFAVTIGVVAVKAGNMAKRSAKENAMETSYRYGGVVKAELETAMTAARTLAQTFEGLKLSGDIPGREAVDTILASLVADNPSFLSTWMVWEPDALDGRDNKFAATPGYDATGRYARFASRKGGEVSLAALKGYETKAYYRLPKTQGTETLMEPFMGSVNNRETLMTTLAVPIRFRGKIMGVTGVSMALSTLQKRLADIRILDTGYLTVISNAGTYVTHPKTKRIGRSVLEADPWIKGLLGKIASGQGFDVANHSASLGEKVVRICEPIRIGKAKTPWAVMVNVPLSEIHAETDSIRRISMGIGTVSVLLLIAIIYAIVHSITGPIKEGVDVAEAMATGDFSRTLTVRNRDEVGKLGESLNHVTENIGGVIRELASGVETLSASSADLAAVSGQMSSGAGLAASKTETVASATEEMSTGMTAVAAAMEQASTNVSMVAAAAEEMTATIQEVAQNTESARSIADTAVTRARQAHTQISDLGAAAQKIDAVTETITDISDQTNLLALNATIEAARAGEAGKGFAVVASEIKELARLTAMATGDIRDQIGGIQQATTISVDSINEITTVIDEISEIVATTATAVEEQAATTREIAENVNQASQGLSEINGNVATSAKAADGISGDIAEVHSQAREMTTSSATVSTNASELLDLAGRLKEVVGRFRV